MTLREDYEREVRALAMRAEDMRACGADAETVARALHAERRALAIHYKGLTPEPLQSVIDQRTRAIYGDPAGPSVDWLRARGKSWEEIAAGAMRPGKPVVG